MLEFVLEGAEYALHCLLGRIRLSAPAVGHCHGPLQDLDPRRLPVFVARSVTCPPALASSDCPERNRGEFRISPTASGHSVTCQVMRQCEGAETASSVGAISKRVSTLIRSVCR